MSASSGEYRRRRFRSLALGVALTVAACGPGDGFLHPRLPPPGEVTECGDGVDNDGDGFADYPEDPGCVSASDPSELDPVEPPFCADGVDNDGDTLTDYPADPQCSSRSDNDESN